jgi:hypothetical protein
MNRLQCLASIFATAFNAFGDSISGGDFRCFRGVTLIGSGKASYLVFTFCLLFNDLPLLDEYFRKTKNKSG